MPAGFATSSTSIPKTSRRPPRVGPPTGVDFFPTVYTDDVGAMVVPVAEHPPHQGAALTGQGASQAIRTV